MRSAGPQGATGRPGADPTTGREKGALSQTLRVCRARWRGACDPLRQHTRVRTLRARTREPVRGACHPPQPPKRAARRAARGQPRTPAGAWRPLHPGLCGPSPSASILGGPGADGPRGSPPGSACVEPGPGEGRALVTGQSPAMGHGREAQTHAICVASGNAPCSATCGRLVGGDAAERRASRGLREGEKDARRWAVPCHGAWQGTPASLGRSGGLKPCPLRPCRAAAGRLDPASAPEWPCMAGAHSRRREHSTACKQLIFGLTRKDEVAYLGCAETFTEATL